MHISTQRLLLREAEDADISSLSAYHIDRRYLEHYTTPPDAAEVIGKAKNWAMESPRLNFQLVITRSGESRAIGCGGVRGRGYPDGKAEIGIEMNPSYWGVGYASEAVLALVQFSQSIGIAVLHAKTTCSNVRAHRLFLNAGFWRLESGRPDGRSEFRRFLDARTNLE